MPSPFTFSETQDPGAARVLLRDLVEQLISDSGRDGLFDPEDDVRAVRVEIPIKPVDALEWLRLQAGGVKTYWYDREHDFEMAGLGAADIISGELGQADRGARSIASMDQVFGEMRKKIAASHENLRYYGGLRFHPTHNASSVWRNFCDFRFTLPRVEVLNRGGQSYLACNVIRSQPVDERILDDILSELHNVQFGGDREPPLIPGIRTRQDKPNRRDWERIVSSALESISTGAFEKIVLARESLLTLTDVLEPLSLLALVSDDVSRAYRFCFQIEDGVAFVGASPEMLYKRQTRFVQSEAVAGTRHRGDSTATDAMLGSELLHSDKDLREHRYVLDTIRNVFTHQCNAVHEDTAVSLLRIKQCQHLYCHIEGILKDSATDATLLCELNPTPAVGGFPTEAALESIALLEPFDRGWYAGPVGWIGHNAAEFAVAIRSGMVRGDTVRLYAGAGIVDGSSAELEWLEIENKMEVFLAALTGASSDAE